MILIAVMYAGNAMTAQTQVQNNELVLLMRVHSILRCVHRVSVHTAFRATELPIFACNYGGGLYSYISSEAVFDMTFAVMDNFCFMYLNWVAY